MEKLVHRSSLSHEGRRVAHAAMRQARKKIGCIILYNSIIKKKRREFQRECQVKSKGKRE